MDTGYGTPFSASSAIYIRKGMVGLCCDRIIKTLQPILMTTLRIAKKAQNHDNMCKVGRAKQILVYHTYYSKVALASVGTTSQFKLSLPQSRT